MSAEATPAFLPFLVDELSRLQRERQTGTLFVTTMNLRLAQIGVRDGEVVYLSYQNIEGAAGLELLQQEVTTHTGVSRFVDGRIRRIDDQLPPTAEVIARLRPGNTRTRTDAAARLHSLTPAVRALIERELTEMIGPYATVLCQEILGAGMTVEAALIELAKELPEPALAEKLRADVLRALR